MVGLLGNFIEGHIMTRKGLHIQEVAVDAVEDLEVIEEAGIAVSGAVNVAVAAADSEAERVVDSEAEKVASEAEKVDSEVRVVDSEAGRVDIEAERVVDTEKVVDSEAGRVGIAAVRMVAFVAAPKVIVLVLLRAVDSGAAKVAADTVVEAKAVEV